MTATELRSALLATLYRTWQENGARAARDFRELALIVGAREDDALDTLQGLRDENLAENGITSGTRDDWRITSDGRLAFEAGDEPLAVQFVQHNSFAGAQMQNTAIGSGNTISATYVVQSVTALREAIEKADDLKPEEKLRWGATFDELAIHPLFNTLVQVAVAAMLARGG